MLKARTTGTGQLPKLMPTTPGSTLVIPMEAPVKTASSSGKKMETGQILAVQLPYPITFVSGPLTSQHPNQPLQVKIKPCRGTFS